MTGCYKNVHEIFGFVKAGSFLTGRSAVKDCTAWSYEWKIIVY